MAPKLVHELTSEIGELRCTLSEFTDKKYSKMVFVHPRKKSPFYKNSGHYVCHACEPISTKDPKFGPCVAYTISFGGVSLERKDLLTSGIREHHFLTMKLIHLDPFMVIKSHVNASSSVQGVTNQMSQMTMGGYPGQVKNRSNFPSFLTCFSKAMEPRQCQLIQLVHHEPFSKQKPFQVT